MVINIGTILLVALIVLLIGGLPTWPHSKSWGYGPSGMFSLMLVVIIVLMVMGRI